MAFYGLEREVNTALGDSKTIVGVVTEGKEGKGAVWLLEFSKQIT